MQVSLAKQLTEASIVNQIKIVDAYVLLVTCSLFDKIKAQAADGKSDLEVLTFELIRINEDLSKKVFDRVIQSLSDTYGYTVVQPEHSNRLIINW